MTFVQSSHKRLLTRLTLLLHFFIAIITFLASRLPSFDSSASLVLDHEPLRSLLRWDVFHYAHIAKGGYVYEYEYAFFPGIPIIMHICGKLFQAAGVLTRDFEGAMLAGPVASAVIAVDAVHTLYDLSLYHLRSPHVALLVSVLSLLSSSPVTLRYAPSAEIFFTYLSYKGMLRSAQEHFVQASVLFALASFFRSNGMMLAGYIMWGMLIRPVLYGSTADFTILSRNFILRTFSCILLSALPIMPLVWHQYNGYVKFCIDNSENHRPWCAWRLPFIYSFVQSEYWGVGPFRYWTLQQTPNVLLGSPVLILLIYGSLSHIRHVLMPRISALVQRDTNHIRSTSSAESKKDPFFNATLTPHAIHALIFSLILLISAHTQIALRLASALPFTYWTAAWLFLREPHTQFGDKRANITGQQNRNIRNGLKPRISRAARLWLGWSIAWGMISLVTWGVFLPPA
ncbi:GPI18 [Sanghuangporus weigelae]